MKIAENYKIEAVPLNIVLSQKRDKTHYKAKKNSKETWAVVGYFSTVKNALQYMVDNEINGVGLDDFKKVVEKQDELYTLIEKVCPNITVADLK